MNIKFLKANNGDSILIKFKGEDNKNINILIDGGMPQTYYNSDYNDYGDLFDVIEDIKENKEKINLLILTHIDNDHIGGILKWIELDNNAHQLIDKVWFNSGKTIAEYFSEKENEDLNVFLNIFNTTETSIKQGKKFENYIENNNIWDKEIIKSGKIADNNRFEIKVLSPDNLSLEKLLKEHKKPKHNYYTGSNKNDWSKNIIDFIDEEENNKFKFEKDNSVSNGSSISFLLTLDDYNFLFLADSHPEVILTSLVKLGYDKKNPIKVDFLKVSHHGSHKNTNKELLEVIDTNNYIISTSSEFHNHPDKRTLSRIINKNQNATIYFNYDEVLKNIFSRKDFQDFQNLQVKNTSELLKKWE